MALVAAAVVPHSPLLIPTVAKQHLERSRQTLTSIRTLGAEIYARQPDVIVMLSSHGQTVDGLTAIEVDDALTGTLADFGDLASAIKVPGAVSFAHQLKEAAEDVGVPIILQSHRGLDYGVTVPWLTLWAEPVDFRILPMTIGAGTTETFIRLGAVLRDFFQTRPTRVALIASGDTDRRPRDASEADRRPTPGERILSEAIVAMEVGRLTELSINHNCLLGPLTVLLACLQGLPGRGVVQSFEVPLTVGQLVASFELHA